MLKRRVLLLPHSHASSHTDTEESGKEAGGGRKEEAGEGGCEKNRGRETEGKERKSVMERVMERGRASERASEREGERERGESERRERLVQFSKHLPKETHADI